MDNDQNGPKFPSEDQIFLISTILDNYNFRDKISRILAIFLPTKKCFVKAISNIVYDYLQNKCLWQGIALLQVSIRERYRGQHSMYIWSDAPIL